MGPDKDLYSDWVVIETGSKQYIGKYEGLDTDDRIPSGGVRVSEAFELLVMKIQQPQPNGVPALTQLNVSVPEALCSGGARMTLWPSKMRFLQYSEVGDFDKHVRFIELAKQSFLANRAAESGLVLPEGNKLNS
jgi:hypothetical protein